MVIAGFHHDEQIEWIGSESRFVAASAALRVRDARSANFLRSPDWGNAGLNVNEVDQRLDFRAGQIAAETGHLGGDAAIGDDVFRGVFAQTFEIAGQ